jgi:5-bromo-4-chloroindolyl phosphate hydrolysis protein
MNRLNNLIKKTEAAVWKEQQPKKRFELYTKLQEYKKQLEEITHGEA